MKLAFVPIAAFAIATPAVAVPIAVAPAISVEQGAVHRDRLPAGASDLALDGKPVRFAADGSYIVGFGRDAASKAMLTWQGAAGERWTRAIIVTPRQWRVQNLATLPLRPVPDAEFEQRRPAELERIRAARADVSTLLDWQQPFITPAKGPVTGVYGSQRIYSGTPSAPHAGLDIGAPPGAPVVAPAGGVVRLAEGPFTLEGNLVMIDHGFGLVSSFLHLSHIDVKPGDVVKQGQAIGAVGRSGRATGPHLHWGVSWTDVRVDPARLLVRDEKDK